ncbi:uncharacterized protein LOC6736581 [Drosophila simulans]|uniref:Anon-Payne n=1 Tax=Drosophila simulans TaxID=7240 RepID=B4QP33_DROSI|nr:uncharacterized protein LOC6736581 [Drosophila simulans]EDX09028.1 anon-Payne [Drosophila simulans]KMY97278.1 uncharacterized protein Dsimw501_GD13352 [Drosophila simulans]
MAITLDWLLLVTLASGSLALWSPQLVPPTGGLLPPSPPATLAPPPTLSQDLEEIQRLIQSKPLNQLLVRYLINDAQFQAFVRIINSNAAVTARWRLLSQPELILFLQWTDQQLLASGGSFELEEQRLKVSLLNQFPYWSGTVFGWQGFLNEVQLYFPLYAIRAHIDAKVLQQGIFAQFWSRLQGLRVMYERWLTTVETTQVLAELQKAGIDTVQLDGIIRELLGWNAVNGTVEASTAAPGTPAAPTAIPGAVLPPVNTVSVVV